MVESRQGEAKLGMKMSGSASASGIFTVLLKQLQNIDKSFQLYVVVTHTLISKLEMEIKQEMEAFLFCSSIRLR